MSEWMTVIVTGALSSLIGGGIVALFGRRTTKKDEFEKRLRKVELGLSFIKGQLSNRGQTSIEELSQKQAEEDRERLSKPKTQ